MLATWHLFDSPFIFWFFFSLFFLFSGCIFLHLIYNYMTVVPSIRILDSIDRSIGRRGRGSVEGEGGFDVIDISF